MFKVGDLIRNTKTNHVGQVLEVEQGVSRIYWSTGHTNWFNNEELSPLNKDAVLVLLQSHVKEVKEDSKPNDDGLCPTCGLPRSWADVDSCDHYCYNGNHPDKELPDGKRICAIDGYAK